MYEFSSNLYAIANHKNLPFLQSSYSTLGGNMRGNQLLTYITSNVGMLVREQYEPLLQHIIFCEFVKNVCLYSIEIKMSNAPDLISLCLGLEREKLTVAGGGYKKFTHFLKAIQKVARTANRKYIEKAQKNDIMTFYQYKPANDYI
jgi:hypothetical protein